jgi:ubiquinone/menaquinone biosynthesis C-methylase UbiE
VTLPNWYIDETAHAGSEHLDPGYVPTYDEKAGTDPQDDLARLLELGLNESQTLVDLGAGTGTFALAAAPHGRRVVAVDVSQPMLGALRSKLERAGIANVEPVHAGFLSYAHTGEPADVVYSRHALHHLPDFWKAIALTRIAAILKPGGVLYLRDLIYAFEPAETDQVIESWLSHAAATPERGWTRAELETHIREEFSPFAWLLEPMIERAGFTVQSIQRDNAIFSTYICRKTA